MDKNLCRSKALKDVRALKDCQAESQATETPDVVRHAAEQSFAREGDYFPARLSAKSPAMGSLNRSPW